MANFIDCTTNNFTFETLVASLFSKESLTGQVYFRICIKSAGQDCNVIPCSSKDDFVELFNQSLELGADGFPVLRVVLVSYSRGEGLEPAQNCGEENSTELIARQSFICDSDGNVALAVASICPAEQ